MLPRLDEIRFLWPVTVVSNVSAMFGLTKAMFAFHLILSGTALGTAAGPTSVLALSAVDAIIGIMAFVTGAFLYMRKRWALQLIRVAWLPVIAYEVGRSLALNAGTYGELRAYDVGMSLLVLIVFIYVWICVRSPLIEEYVSGRRTTL